MEPQPGGETNESNNQPAVFKMIGWIAIAVTLLSVGAVIWRVDDWSRDWTQNTAELDPQASRPELRPVDLDADLDQAVQQITRWAESQPAWDVQSVQRPDDQSARIHLTRTTRIFRFVDDIHATVRTDASGQGVRIDAHSQSRVGKGDLGQNPRNLAELTRGLRGQ
jgi:uncharacterized protein (DUF1499 family)